MKYKRVKLIKTGITGRIPAGSQWDWIRLYGRGLYVRAS